MSEEKGLNSGKMGMDESEAAGEKKETSVLKPLASAGARPPLPPITSARPVVGGTKQPPTAPGSSRPMPVSTKLAPPSQVSSPVQKASVPPVPAHPAAAPTAAPASTVPRVASPAAVPKASASKVVKPKQDKPPENDPGIWRISRKNFLNVAGWFAFFSFLVTATIGAIRLMVPRVLYEPPSAFKAGFPEDYIIGEVNETYKDEHRVWIVREQDGFYALAAICTHLGCTPRWAPIENKFKCPCHGSGYHKDGINFEGPTPRPLERLKIGMADDGQILVDRNIKFLYEKGEWSRPDAYLTYG